MSRWNATDHVELDHPLRCPQIDCLSVFTAADLAVLDGDGTFFEHEAPTDGIVERVPSPACPSCKVEFPEDLVARGHRLAFVSLIGPGGTGKTGLLRRIFHELVVEQRLRGGYGLSAELWSAQRGLWVDRMGTANKAVAAKFNKEPRAVAFEEATTAQGRTIWVFVLRSVLGSQPPIVLLLQDIEGESTAHNILTSKLAQTLVLTASHDAVMPDSELHGFDDRAESAHRAFRNQLNTWYPDDDPDVAGRSAVLVLTQADLYASELGLVELLPDRQLAGPREDLEAISKDSQRIASWLQAQNSLVFQRLAAWLNNHREVQIDVTGVGGIGVLPSSVDDDAGVAVGQEGTATTRAKEPSADVLGAGRALDPIILTLHRLGYLETEEVDQ